MQRCLVLLAVLLGLAAPLDADEQVGSTDSYAVTAWSPEAGLPASIDTIFAMTQDVEGYLWLGTRSGLIRFDGSQFFPWGGRGEPPLPGRSVRALAASRDGSLWIAFSDADGVTRIRNGQVITYAGRDGLAEGAVATIIEDRQGTMWTAGRVGLVRLTGERWERVGVQTGLGENEAFSVFEDRGGRLWVGTPEGVFRGSTETGVFELVAPHVTYAYSFAESESGEIWVTDAQQVVRSLDGDVVLERSAAVPSPAAGWRLVADPRGTVWIAALGNGLLRVREDANTGRPVLEPFSGGRIRGSVQSLYRDREDNLWVGLRDGLMRLTESFVANDIALEGLTDEGVRALALAGDGSVWAATTYGLNRFSGQRRDIYNVKQTMALHGDADGSVWVATIQGISRIEREQLRAVATLPLDRVVAMSTDKDGRLWLCSGVQGVSRLENERLVRVPDDASFAHKPCSSIYTDRRRRLWVGFTTGGVAVHDGHEWRSYADRNGLAAGRVNAILEDHDGDLWFSTVLGLSRFRDGRFTTASSKNGLPERLERSFVADDQGYLWLTVNGGSAVVRLNREEVEKVAADPSHQVRYDLYDRSDGFPPVLPFWSPTAVRGGDGRLWFATGIGVAVIDVARLPQAQPPVAPRVENVIADGVPIPAGDTFQLPYSTTTLQIDYAALSLTAGTKLRFRYMLEGVDPGWVYAGLRRQASFTNLQPGSYTFRITASSDGLWNEPEAVWAFSLPPPFYRTKWFYALVASLVASTFWGYWWLSLRAVRNRYALVLAERARVSREIHDTLLQSLGAVGIQLEVVASHLNGSERTAGATALQRLRQQVQQCVVDARQSIWELRAPSLEARDLAEVLRDLADHANWGRPVDVEISSTGRARPCSPHAQEQLLRIAREAITNAVRHGGAQHIEVLIAYRRRTVSVRVSDDGTGFVPENVQTNQTHCGLASMRERAERLGGRLAVMSGVGTGAVVEAVVPLR